MDKLSRDLIQTNEEARLIGQNRLLEIEAELGKAAVFTNPFEKI